MSPEITPSTASNDTAAMWMRQYRTQKRACDEANGVLRNIIKRAKNEGINTKAMIAAVAATKLDPEQVAADLRETIRYSQILHIPLSQGELFDGWDDTQSSQSQTEEDLWRAEEDGYRAGRGGMKQDDAPHAPESEAHRAWCKGWAQGQAAIARELGPDVKPANASRARPARAANPLSPAASPDSTVLPDARAAHDVVAPAEVIERPWAPAPRAKPRSKKRGKSAPRRGHAGTASAASAAGH